MTRWIPPKSVHEAAVALCFAIEDGDVTLNFSDKVDDSVWEEFQDAVKESFLYRAEKGNREFAAREDEALREESVSEDEDRAED